MWAAARPGRFLPVTPSQRGLWSEARQWLGDPPLCLSLSRQPFLAWLSLLVGPLKCEEGPWSPKATSDPVLDYVR